MVGLAGFEPAISCSRSKRVGRYPTARKFGTRGGIRTRKNHSSEPWMSASCITRAWSGEWDSNPQDPDSQPRMSTSCIIAGNFGAAERTRTSTVLPIRPSNGRVCHFATAANIWWSRRESNPRHPACKTGVLPLNYGTMVPTEGIEPPPSACDADVLPLDYAGFLSNSFNTPFK